MYGELHYYQPVGGDTRELGQFDAKRIVALFGYQFDKNTQFVTEWELEHADEIFLEQAFVKHRLKGHLSMKAGMILIPMGWVNENHEPNNYFSVDRPFIDQVLIPSTWRDIGVGITGLLPDLDLRYQAYLVNGLKSYKDGTPTMGGAKPLRSARQKGSKTLASGLPAFSGQLEYYGNTNSKIGLSLYHGKSHTDAYAGLPNSAEFAITQADSTTVDLTMVALHVVTDMDRWKIKGQVVYARNGGQNAYNTFTGSDLGAASLGAYLEMGRLFAQDKWAVFGRYSALDTHLQDEEGSTNLGLDHILTTGINFFPAPGTAMKIEAQVSQFHDSPQLSINTGVGVWF